MEYLGRVAKHIRDFYQSLSQGRKIGLTLTLLGVLASIVALFFWAGETTYQTLYSNLASEDATAIMRLLREKKIPFRVENDGKTIKIPPEAVYDLRLELASSGYPQAGVIGYEVFDKQSFSTTSFVQKLNQKRALEGELMRTINQLKGVKRSRVHLALPQKSTFIEDQKRPSASVVIELEPGNFLVDKQITGISHLVASAIEGMELGDVIIVDSNGKMLSKNTTDPIAKQTAGMLELQQKLEQDYEKRIEEIVSKVVGEGRVVAKVALDLDFTQMSETQTTFDQEGTAVRAQQKENQVMDGTRPVPSGAPGAAANTPGATPAGKGPEVRSNTQKAYETTNFAVPETVRKSTKPAYTVKKLSVSVLVDSDYIAKSKAAPAAADAATAGNAEAGKPGKWDEQKTKLQTIVASAVGLDKSRGDIIEIQGMEFRKDDLEDAEAAIKAAEQRRLYRYMLEYGVLGLVIALFFMFVVRPFIKWLTDNTVESMESFLPKTIEELEKLQVEDEGIAKVEEVMPVIVDKVDPEKVEGEMIKEKIVTLIEKNPSKAAMILHEWILKAPLKQKEGEAAAAE